MRRERNFIRWLYWALMAGLVVAVALGVTRQYRASELTAAISAGMPTELRLDHALEITRRVASRFQDIEVHGPASDTAPWPVRTDADYLLTGGDCGHAAGALGATFVSRRQPVRIIQVNVGPAGAMCATRRVRWGRWGWPNTPCGASSRTCAR